MKIGKFTHSDAGQMNLYLNYAREHWTLPDENPPLGLILCSEKNEAVAHYALGNLHNKVLSSQYKRPALPPFNCINLRRALVAGDEWGAVESYTKKCETLQG